MFSFLADGEIEQYLTHELDWFLDAGSSLEMKSVEYTSSLQRTVRGARKQCTKVESDSHSLDGTRLEAGQEGRVINPRSEIRCKKKEVLIPKTSDKFIFPVADDSCSLRRTNQSSGWEEIFFLKIISVRDQPARDKEHNNVLRGRRTGFNQQTDDAEGRNHLWSVVWEAYFKSSRSTKGKLYVPNDVSFQLPLK